MTPTNTSSHQSRVTKVEMTTTKHIIGAVIFAALGTVMVIALPATGADRNKRGEYLVRIMDCTGCHTPGSMAGKPDQARFLGGGDVGFEMPGLGIFYPPNLTPDRESGIGSWSESDIAKAMRTGQRPDGRELAPIMPWRSYAALSDADVRAVASYLKSLKPVRSSLPPMVGEGENPPAPYLGMVMPKSK